MPECSFDWFKNFQQNKKEKKRKKENKKRKKEKKEKKRRNTKQQQNVITISITACLLWCKVNGWPHLSK